MDVAGQPHEHLGEGRVDLREEPRRDVERGVLVLGDEGHHLGDSPLDVVGQVAGRLPRHIARGVPLLAGGSARPARRPRAPTARRARAAAQSYGRAAELGHAPRAGSGPPAGSAPARRPRRGGAASRRCGSSAAEPQRQPRPAGARRARGEHAAAANPHQRTAQPSLRSRGSPATVAADARPCRQLERRRARRRDDLHALAGARMPASAAASRTSSPPPSSSRPARAGGGSPSGAPARAWPRVRVGVAAAVAREPPPYALQVHRRAAASGRRSPSRSSAACQRCATVASNDGSAVKLQWEYVGERHATSSRAAAGRPLGARSAPTSRRRARPRRPALGAPPPDPQLGVAGVTVLAEVGVEAHQLAAAAASSPCCAR